MSFCFLSNDMLFLEVDIMVNLKDKLKNLPMSPGVYIMKNADGDVIYVGKSKLLKNRVSQYFMNSKNHTPKTVAMVENIADFEYIMTDTEVEALVLECNLIKKYRPKYNILLKDDKQYPYIKITLDEEYPRIFMTRKVRKDGAKYFGPFMSAIMVKSVLDTIKKTFKVRSCNKNITGDKTGRPCLYYHIGQCSAPCSSEISKDEYRETFHSISDVLEGKYDDIIKELEEKMYNASKNLEFERAARYRDRVESIKILGEKQKMISTGSDNRDIIGVFSLDNESCVRIFYMRDGKIQGSEQFIVSNADTNSEVVSEFVKQYYFTATNIPKEILIPYNIEDTSGIEEWLSKKVGYKIKLLCPQRGEKAKLVKMVNKNAEESLRQHFFKRDREKIEQNIVLSELKELLSLERTPHRIELYDISNISGAQSVGACIVYNNAKASKKDYRKFNIKTVDGADDYESMRESISRRINKAYEEEEYINNKSLLPEKAKFLPLPDLILLDGGKGHVSAIKMLMETLGEDIPVFGLVKDDNHKTRGITDENTEFTIDRDGILFKVLTEMQEEVHRFAISAFRKRHEDTVIHSELEDISGIGEEKRKKLLSAFLSIENIKNSDIDALSKVIDKRSAKNVFNYFHGDEKNE